MSLANKTVAHARPKKPDTLPPPGPISGHRTTLQKPRDVPHDAPDFATVPETRGAGFLTFGEQTTALQIREVIGSLGAVAARLCELEVVIRAIKLTAGDDPPDELHSAAYLLSEARRSIGEALSSANVCVKPST